MKQVNQQKYYTIIMKLAPPIEKNWTMQDKQTKFKVFKLWKFKWINTKTTNNW